MTVDVAVVGGGPSGLFAALGLIRAFDGLKVKVTAKTWPSTSLLQTHQPSRFQSQQLIVLFDFTV